MSRKEDPRDQTMAYVATKTQKARIIKEAELAQKTPSKYVADLIEDHHYEKDHPKI